MSRGACAVLVALKIGPATTATLAARTRQTYAVIGATVPYLLRQGRIIRIGVAADARAAGMLDVISGNSGFRNMRCDARVVALPGTPLLPPAPPSGERISHPRYRDYHAERRQAQSRSERTTGSGHVAAPITIGRGFRWFSGVSGYRRGAGAE